MVVIAQMVDLQKTFKAGDTIKIYQCDGEFTGTGFKPKVDTEYKIVKVFKHYVQCITSCGYKACFNVGDLVINGYLKGEK